MNRRERTLLALAIVGFVVPNTMIAMFAVQHSFAFDGYFQHSSEPLTALLALDLGIAFVTFSLWAAWEGKRLEMRSWWVPVPASLLVGLCFALPLFLLLRERALRKPTQLQVRPLVSVRFRRSPARRANRAGRARPRRRRSPGP